MSEKIKKQTVNTILEIALYVISGLAFLYFIMNGRYEKCFRAALIIIVLLLLRGLLAWTKSELSSPLRFSILLFITITMLLANLFNMYDVIPHLDKIEHLLSGVILFFVGQFIFEKITRKHQMITIPRSLMIWFSLLFAIAMAGLWEVYEFSTDKLFGLTSQNNSLVDTMLDIICGTVGAIGAVLFLVFKDKKQ
ncbi:hypothetical protein [Brevibacillus daliensis]|uniref:hypothetical protein n=1 Tax=Brevibacillus daliensis TaxID=2892995 RepID=UPI001E3B8140|nr:hypothetical protein [Brevibacillus daliensis]